MSDTENNAPVPTEEAKEHKEEHKEEDMAVDVGGSGDHKDAHPEVKENETAAPEEKTEKPEAKEKAEEKEKPDKSEEKAQTTPKKMTPQKRKRKETESEEEEEEEEGEPKLGLLEAPVIIVSGKRERKKTEFIDVSVTNTPKEKFQVPEGKGVALGEIENVTHYINKTKAEDLKTVHRFCFNSPGGVTTLKKNLRKFCGFSFSEGSPEYERKAASMNKLTMAQVKLICEILDLEKGGTKEQVVNRLMEFGLKPAASGKPIKGSKKRKSKSGEKKRKTKKKTPKKEGKKGAAKKSKSSEEVESSDSDGDDSDKDVENEKSDDEAEASDDEKEKSSDEETKEPPKKKKKVEAKKPEAKKPEKKAAPKKAAEKKNAAPKKKPLPELSSDDDSSDDDEPLVAKTTPQPPNEEELKTCIKKILDGANLEEITMKTVCKQVYGKYPTFDLSDKKDFIKSTVKSIIR